MKGAVQEDPTLSSRELDALFAVHHISILNCLRNLGKVHRCTRLASHNLDDKNKKCEKMCEENLEKLNLNPLFKPMITSDEKWIYLDNHKRRGQ